MQVGSVADFQATAEFHTPGDDPWGRGQAGLEKLLPTQLLETGHRRGKKAVDGSRHMSFDSPLYIHRQMRIDLAVSLW
jgi:hypothetical protein